MLVVQKKEKIGQIDMEYHSYNTIGDQWFHEYDNYHEMVHFAYNNQMSETGYH